MTNCLFFAVALFLRRRHGYITVRKSRWGRFPHFLYTEQRNGTTRYISYIPLNPKHKKLPPPFFKGRVKWGD